MNGSDNGDHDGGHPVSGSTVDTNTLDTNTLDTNAVDTSVVDTNVVRVAFGVRRPRRTRPARPQRWATLVLPFQTGVDPTPPPQAA